MRRAFTLLLLLLAAPLGAQTAADSVAGYAVREAMIPTRDGARLHTLIYRPAGHDEALPFLMVRTPYGITGRAGRYFQAYLKELAADGYVMVLQDIRGRYGSEGTFVMNRPLHDAGDPKGVDESTDTWDTVEWLLDQVPNNNGRVGVLGISYPGWLAAMAGINPHPAVKAVSPQAPMTDTWIGDDFFHQGAFRLSYGFEYAADMELSNDGSVPLPITRYDTYDWYLAQGPLRNLTTLLAGKVPTWTNFTRHPTYDAFWKARSLPTYLTRLSVPTLTVGGWWDQEDFYGALATYAALEKLDTAGINYLVMGPWNHGGWQGAGDSLGKISFADSTGTYFREQVQAPWFAYWLKDRGRLPLPEALLFVAGRNDWKAFDHWPPRAEAPVRQLYFRADGRLSFEPPSGAAAAFDPFVSDPAHPVPYRARPIQQTYHPRGSSWSAWQVEDQRLAHNRPDVLSWETEPLDADLTIAGDVVAHLFASTTGQDADWVVKLIDVYPDSARYLAPRMGGFQLMVTGDILRGRYRAGWDRPAPLVPNRVTPFTVDLHQQAYTFRKGHRIMVQVQSTWFPVYDRNPQTWVPNIFEAPATAFRAQTHRVYRSTRHPSHVQVQVLAP
ncbi:MAG: CocE/NonD family hydrolase [Gemmatimonadetes bacterium]|nr:CocE/NonD family hydrolase [Gemmatimonadota bacterium]MBK7352093.1 CocE/NonD family hydrolase [Gemmatimonadota bacterium]MBK7784870.1 CocE/NonD family hydrolase [Gemmatimonadota bacterium]MBK7925825.1 CocE/NonD family hydrolase [Gemmatimonadota bacterium]MBK9066543.1 CocE/NonD family hydrolase [Gemmatimonadota bacterium]